MYLTFDFYCWASHNYVISILDFCIELLLCKCITHFPGHFPWLVKLLKGAFSYTEVGKAVDYVARVALDLIKARRQEEHTEKVYT